jgi:hypothetical protein
MIEKQSCQQLGIQHIGVCDVMLECTSVGWHRLPSVHLVVHGFGQLYTFGH